MESLFKKVAGLMTWNFIKKRIQHRHFPVNFEKFFKKPYLQNTSGCLLVLIAPFQPPFYVLITLSSFFLSFFPFISNNCIYYNWFSLLLFPIIYQKINVNVVKTIYSTIICRRTLEKIQISIGNCRVSRRISMAV